MSFPLTWPEKGYYEAGTVSHVANFDKIRVWAKMAKVDLNSTWALEVKGSKVTIYQFVKDEAGDLVVSRDSLEPIPVTTQYEVDL